MRRMVWAIYVSSYSLAAPKVLENTWGYGAVVDTVAKHTFSLSASEQGPAWFQWKALIPLKTEAVARFSQRRVRPAGFAAEAVGFL
mmetsp:Transcript_38937/g.91904  ORF Transcript_38937/g.91904 Transcript_38937/m.91904 type:complete len:86 (+) Transcript_38937:337-594(+)